MYQYDAVFYDYLNQGAIDSAEAVVPILRRHFPIRSVVDFGCGQGAWLQVWKRLLGAEVLGIDGEYVDPKSLMIASHEFQPCDLTQPVDLCRKFDIVQSLEVAEHLPESAASGFVDSLVRHGDIILFAAAVPGQGGENHINEQPYEYWRDLFLTRGYRLLDMIREPLRDNPNVVPWYRYNTFVYVNKDLLDTLPSDLSKYCTEDAASITDISPPLYKLRKACLRLLPASVLSGIAVIKKHIFAFVKLSMHRSDKERA